MIGLEVDLAGLVHRENVAGQGLRGAVAARVVGARCGQEFTSLQRRQSGIASKLTHAAPHAVRLRRAESGGLVAAVAHPVVEAVPSGMNHRSGEVNLAADTNWKITQWRRTRVRRRARRCST